MNRSKTFKNSNLRKYYELLKRDLTLNEIEKLVRRDVPAVYEFYAREMEKPDGKQNLIMRILVFSRNFFIAFLLKLTAARRLTYSVALFVFFYGLFIGSNPWILVGFIMLNILLALEVTDKLIAKDELEVAREIQMGLMPEQAPFEDCLEISCYSKAAREVGGDYYDFIRPKSDSNRLYIVVGDVKGKGMAAALYMVRVQALLQYLLEEIPSPKEVLIALNHNVCKIMRKDYFISMAITRIHRDGKFTLCRAGHMPVIHYIANERNCKIVEPKGIAIGLENNGCFERTIEEVNLDAKTNDVFVFYTDGLIETMNNKGDQYGEESLLKVIKENATKSTPEIKDSVLKDIAKFSGMTPSHDDLTLIVVKIKKSRKPA
jgi:sigma-B regulation protein RsbU (phosphoserine phosphatase)